MNYVNFYKTAECLEADRYSVIHPIFEYEPDYFRGDVGQYRTINVFMKNVSDVILSGNVENPLEFYPWDL